jgi:uronate dehydrogenase
VGGWVSLDAARALGYEPRDDAERYAADVSPNMASPTPPTRSCSTSGGEFCLPDLGADRLT